MKFPPSPLAFWHVHTMRHSLALTLKVAVVSSALPAKCCMVCHVSGRGVAVGVAGLGVAVGGSGGAVALGAGAVVAVAVACACACCCTVAVGDAPDVLVPPLP